MYAIDLFSGAGGMSEGIIQAGFHILFSSDISIDVEKTYMNRHKQLGLIQDYNTCFLRSDIKNLNSNIIFDKIKNLITFKPEMLEIDAIFGGPPCQGFSRAGKRDPNDPRNFLFREYVRVVSEIKPKYVVMENVVGFTDFKFSEFRSINGSIYYNDTLALDVIQNEFNLIGYNTLKPKILNAADYGVPQKRNRLILIAYRKDCKEPIYPVPINNIQTVTDAISDLNNISDLSTYQKESIQGRTPHFITKKPIASTYLLNHDIPPHSEIVKERFSLYENGENTSKLKKRIESGMDISQKENLLKLLCSKFGNKEIIINAFKTGTYTEEMLDTLLTKKIMRVRVNADLPFPTVVTIADDFISPFDNRTFTVRELARFQSFDDSFEFLGKRTSWGQNRKIEVSQYTQVGNAIPPLLAKAIANSIKSCL